MVSSEAEQSLSHLLQMMAAISSTEITGTASVESVFVAKLTKLSKGYRAVLMEAIQEAHEVCLSTLGIQQIKHLHIYYRSLALGLDLPVLRAATRDSEESGSNIRSVYSLRADSRKSKTQYEKFTDLVGTYTAATEILPPEARADFCTICFEYDDIDDQRANDLMMRGIYPISRSGIDSLADSLLSMRLRPWDATYNDAESAEMQRAYDDFCRIEGKKKGLWETHRKSIAGKYNWEVFPSFDEVFQYGLKASIITIQLVSGRILQKELSQSRDHGKGNLRKLDINEDLLKGARVSLGIRRGSPASALLLFVPVRLTDPSHPRSKQPIGLVAFSAEESLQLIDILKIALIEHTLFLLCRQYELFLIHDYQQRLITGLEKQRLASQLMAHEIAKPFGAVRDMFRILDSSMRSSEDILSAFSKGEFSGDRPVEAVDLYDIVDEVSFRYEADITARNTRLYLKVRKGTKLRVDRFGLEYVVSILFSNAVRHGERLVRVRAEFSGSDDELYRSRLGRSKRIIAIYIENDGPWMTDSQVEMVFKPEGRVDDLPTPKRRRGFGVGLSLALEYARLSGWRIEYKRGAKGRTDQPYTNSFVLKIPLDNGT